MSMKGLESSLRIALIHPGSLGDILLSLPALRALRVSFPRSFLTIIGSPAPLELLRGRYYADQVISIDRADVTDCLMGSAEPSNPVMKMFQEADCVIDWLMGPGGGALSMQWMGNGAANLVASRPVSRAAGGVHRARIFLQALSPLLERAELYPMEVFPTNEDREAGLGLLNDLGLMDQPVLAIHPGSGSSRKSWALSRFIEAALAARSRLGLHPIFLLGPAEQARAHFLKASLSDAAVVLSDLALPALAGLLTRCNGYVGNDSGISHLAASLGIPTLALFGPTDPALWAPLGRNVMVLSRRPEAPHRGEGFCHGCECLDRITVEDVLGAIQTACSSRPMPCG